MLDVLKAYDEDMVKRAMKQVDIHRRGELTYHEFKELMTKLLKWIEIILIDY